MRKGDKANKVTMTKRKLDGKTLTWQGEIVQEDARGTWVFCPDGTEVSDPTGAWPSVVIPACIQLLTPGQWWVPLWWSDNPWVGIDVIAPLEHPGEGGFSYLDLELDLWWRDGQGEIVDQDELQHALDQGWLTQEMATQAETVANQLLARLQSNDPLLTSVGFQMLDRALRGTDPVRG